ncbi:MAG: QueT transporter family protein [Clostridium septicum]|uniref:QueT transporter family protein n=1 Tax=Clostridium septicum TaxID=1504 RepID=A0A9N7JHZ6_CLOSE|nr:QueT transporter family protein [Clostridium septicum]AYE32984.1 QueT transporter family protein [Clostridium septicum]MDU1314199.1 QueT transporter family protein [Clostridium septicum]QAS61148.1 QueT transporter family protein [Clostridium septicum]UEC19500.1 QueT transporter family protein [Clostridium septicum]USR99547.1 QueT transporter family protein [Clostridium septicum]
MKNTLTKRLVKTAIIAALYAILTIILAPISYGPIQFRLSEVMVLLAFFDPFYIGGLTLGCLLSNILGGYGVMDIVFGTIATFMSVSSISLTAKFLKQNKFSLLIASLWPTLFNGVIIGWMLNFVLGVPIFITMLQVAIGEFVVVTILGVSIAIIIKRKYGNKLSLI